ncbi:hypothetical protein, partial [Haloferax sp. DFSO60]|uniref:hypothetical protein n=1 Tax=Haloferax sp. DFSO60 TaxID=3388652 RepID=UPI0039793906
GVACWAFFIYTVSRRLGIERASLPSNTLEESVSKQFSTTRVSMSVLWTTSIPLCEFHLSKMVEIDRRKPD